MRPGVKNLLKYKQLLSSLGIHLAAITQRMYFLLGMYCNRRNLRTRKNFVPLCLWPFVRYRFLYSEHGVAYTGIRAWFSYATKFHTFSRKCEIKSRTNISAITVLYSSFAGPRCSQRNARPEQNLQGKRSKRWQKLLFRKLKQWMTNNGYEKFLGHWVWEK